MSLTIQYWHLGLLVIALLLARPLWKVLKGLLVFCAGMLGLLLCSIAGIPVLDPGEKKRQREPDKMEMKKQAPEEDNEDGRRRWIYDLPLLGQLDAASESVAAAADGVVNPVPIDEWAAEQREKRALANRN